MGRFSKYKREFWRNFPLFLCGVFLVYVAAFDETLFNWVSFDITNRLAITLATIVAAAIPMFFAVGAIKQSLLYGRETLYYYEKMLKHWGFWFAAGIFCIGVVILRFIQSDVSFLTKFAFIAATCLTAAYLIYYAFSIAGKSSSAPQTTYPQSSYPSGFGQKHEK